MRPAAPGNNRIVLATGGLVQSFARRLLARLIRGIRVGRIEIRFDAAAQICAGTPPADAPELDVALRVRGSRAALLLALDPRYYLGEFYASGAIAIERGSLGALLEIVGRNLVDLSELGRQGTGALLERAGNTIAAARRNARFHYDLPEFLYRSFLDRDMQYSCAYFGEPHWTLDKAQLAKKIHVAAKLDLRPGQHVLDIGCGWGGLALTLAHACDVRVTGITLSTEQLRVARERARSEGLSHRVDFQLIDYREVQGRFDRIVSIGMLEHVGRRHLGTFFARIADLLAPSGVALIHSIGRKDAVGGEDRWLRKRIFPGGYVPSISEGAAAVEATGLWLTDVEILRLHYARTLWRWRQRFLTGSSDLATENPRLFRTWDYYLASCEMAFRRNGLMVMQLQLANEVDTLPITRGYIEEREAELTQPRSRKPAQRPEWSVAGRVAEDA